MLLEQCENLEEVETFLQTKTHDGIQHKDANYIMAILDSRKKFVAHERFQYVLLKKFGESDLLVSQCRCVTEIKQTCRPLNTLYLCVFVS